MVLKSLLSTVPALFCVFLGLWLAQLETVDNIRRWITAYTTSTVSTTQITPFHCGRPEMKVRFLSYDPVMVHIEDFLSDAEVTHLKALGESRYNYSTVVFGNGTSMVDTESRTSFSAFLPNDNIVKCVKQRAAEFQGFAPVSDLENLQTVRYTANQIFRAHFDWFPAHENPYTGDVEYGQQPRNRLTTFFAILEANCTGGETDFPFVPTLKWKERPQWCDFIVCEDLHGVRFKPRVGSAIFWVNLLSGDEGHPDTIHSGLKVLEGTKVGLNIWTRGTASSGGLEMYEMYETYQKYLT